MSTSKAPPENQSMQELPPGTPAIDMQDWPNDWLKPQGQVRERTSARLDQRRAEHAAQLQERLAVANSQAAQKRTARVARARELATAIRSARDANPDPKWTKGEGGRFTGSEPGQGGGGESKSETTAPVPPPRRKPKIAGVSRKAHPAKISPSVTSTKFAEVDSDATYVPTGLVTMRQHAPSFAHNAGLHRNAVSYPALRPDEVSGPPEQVARAVIDRMKDNLRYLWGKASPAEMRGREWYRGAHKLVQGKAKQHGLDTASVAGVYAALSPNKDWDQNVYLAEQVLDIYMNRQEHTWDAAMSSTAEQIWKAKDASTLAAVTGKRLGELQEADQIAMWIRTYEQAHGDPAQDGERGYRVFQPDGTLGDFKRNMRKPDEAEGKKTTVTWNTLDSIANAVAALRSGGDRHIISEAMGGKNKVRHFYNNILDPNGEDGDVTIDTHAVGAAWLRPMPEAAKAHALASHPGGEAPAGYETSRDHKGTGVFGTYGFYADAYRELAAELGVLPNQLQAVTWTVKRNYLDAIRLPDAAVAQIDAEWHAFNQGRQTLTHTQDAIWRIVEAERTRRSEQ